MPKSLDQTGVVQVNGAWATSVKYESEVLGTRAGMVDLRFMQGRAEIGRVSLLSEEVAEVLGDKNAAAISRHLAGDADKYLAVVKGELRGTRLHYREVRLEENAIEAGRERALESAFARPADGATAHRTDKPDTPGAAPRPDPDTEPRPAGTPEPDVKPGSSSRTGPVPPHIVARYLVKHDKYYFDDQTVAFVDRGSRLTVQTHNSAVLKDLMTIAKSREWQEIHVTGTKAFRREAWKEAYTAGLKVSGYSPTELELEAAKRTTSRAGGVTTQRTEPKGRAPVTVAPPTANTPEVPRPARAPSRRGAEPARGMVFGTLVDHGVAPYRNDPSKAASYFVTVRDETGGERTHWGVGLADAIRSARSAPSIGDEIGIRRVGSTAVTLPGRDSDGQGVVSPIAAKRHQWLIETATYLKGDPQEVVPEPARAAAASPQPSSAPANGMTRSQEVAAAIRSASTTREELQLKYPEVNRAVFDTLATHEQFAEAYIKARLIRESDRAQVIAQMRDRVAADLERGKSIREPQERVNAILRSSVYEAATRIGRTPVSTEVRQPPVREEAQVRS